MSSRTCAQNVMQKIFAYLIAFAAFHFLKFTCEWRNAFSSKGGSLRQRLSTDPSRQCQGYSASVLPVLWCAHQRRENALQSHLPRKNWSALYFPKQVTVTSVLNNTAVRVIAPLGVSEEEGGIVEQENVMGRWPLFHAWQQVNDMFPPFFISPQSHLKFSTLCSCIKLTIMTTNQFTSHSVQY